MYLVTFCICSALWDQMKMNSLNLSTWYEDVVNINTHDNISYVYLSVYLRFSVCQQHQSEPDSQSASRYTKHKQPAPTHGYIITSVLFTEDTHTHARARTHTVSKHDCLYLQRNEADLRPEPISWNAKKPETNLRLEEVHLSVCPFICRSVRLSAGWEDAGGGQDGGRGGRRGALHPRMWSFLHRQLSFNLSFQLNQSVVIINNESLQSIDSLSWVHPILC